MVQAPLLLLLTSWITLTQQQVAPPAPSAPPTVPNIGGSGPPPAPVTTAQVGPWKPPSGSGGLPPPSLSGMGRQIRLNSATDFCILMPPDPTKQNLVDAEADAVAYCTNPVNNTRPMPDGFIKTSHFRHTDKYVQISGTYDPSKMNLSPNDCGGEYDNHGAMGVGNPVGAAVDGAHDFMQFMGGCDIPGNAVFCLRACHGDDSYEYCKNTYDLMGCLWVMPGLRDAWVLELQRELRSSRGSLSATGSEDVSPRGSDDTAASSCSGILPMCGGRLAGPTGRDILLGRRRTSRDCYGHSQRQRQL
ncbi:hypothetical protein PtA15_14A112 [Puccinia triticina]|uniref:Uncharacterized protein n=1 Tax=Puccinia triticina TaxID=208348 RepID=A0ABY7D2Y1_9BASI|nr:uncharacterized protein PtA15_14A112 [Puccinia triticina]WAQ91230.1 hypothetical protein PtA15_14A112 [Puccinia triticina]